MTPTYRQVPYNEAQAASERGEVVTRSCACAPQWQPFDAVLCAPEPNHYEFRVLDPKPDPYAELKAAQAEGKTIQMLDGDVWRDLSGFVHFDFRIELYRVKPNLKPDELVIEPGKEPEFTLTESQLRKAAYVFTAAKSLNDPRCGEFIDYIRELLRVSDTPAPYDNWDKGGVPSWAMWQAMDESGSWIFAENKPTQLGSVWGCDSGPNDLETGFGSLPKHLYPINFTGTWDQSLQQRPTK